MAKDVEKEQVNEQENKKNDKTAKKNVHEVIVKIEGDNWTKALDKVFALKQKTVKVDGFRKGKVPRDIYEKKFGKESLFLDAADSVLQDAYVKAMEESKLIPVVKPLVDIRNISENEVEFIFKIITKPEVKIKKYSGLNVQSEKAEVTKEEIDHELSHLLEEYTELVVKEDGQVENGDVAIIDFEGFKDGEAFEGGKGENYSLEIGSNTFIPGFEEQVIGMKSLEEKELNVTFPEDYGVKDLAGAAVVFKVKVNEIKQKVARELDEDFFEDLGMDGVNSEETLRKELEKTLLSQKEVQIENAYIDKLLEEVSKNVEVDIPEEMVEEEIDRMMVRFEEQIMGQGLSLDVYYQITKSSEKDLRSQLEKEAYTNILYRLMLEEIATLEKIEVSLDDASKEADELADKYQMPRDEFLKHFGGIEMIQYDLEMRKVIDKLKELNKF